MRSLCPIVALTLAAGCGLPLEGLFEDDGGLADAGPDRDASGFDAGPREDAGPLIRRDGGPPQDGGGCPPGFVDVDGDPANGCECQRSPNPREICNGIDDDCDPATIDGSAEVLFGMPCDSPLDSDFCREGTWVCNAGAFACTDPAVDDVERCDVPGDQDCDGLTDEGGAVDATVFYDDDDGDTYGDDADTQMGCTAPPGYVARGGDCDDTTPSISPGVAETCDGRDEDCSGLADDNGGCAPCTVVHNGTTPYMFCNTNRQGWGGASSFCTSFGYRLVTFDDPAENTWVATAASGVESREYWIGLRQVSGGTWRWTSGADMTWENWSGSEPNNGGCCRPDEDCAEMRTSGRWNDYLCDEARAFICERP